MGISYQELKDQGNSIELERRESIVTERDQGNYKKKKKSLIRERFPHPHAQERNNHQRHRNTHTIQIDRDKVEARAGHSKPRHRHFLDAVESTSFEIKQLARDIDNEIEKLKYQRDLMMHSKQSKMKQNAAIQSDMAMTGGNEQFSTTNSNVEFTIEKYSSKHKFVCTSPRYSRDEQTSCRPRMRTIGLQKNTYRPESKCSNQCFDYAVGDVAASPVTVAPVSVYHVQNNSPTNNGCHKVCQRYNCSGNYNGIVCNQQTYAESGVTPCSEYNYCRDEYYYDYANNHNQNNQGMVCPDGQIINLPSITCQVTGGENVPSMYCGGYCKCGKTKRNYGRFGSDLNTEDFYLPTQTGSSPTRYSGSRSRSPSHQRKVKEEKTTTKKYKFAMKEREKESPDNEKDGDQRRKPKEPESRKQSRLDNKSNEKNKRDAKLEEELRMKIRNDKKGSGGKPSTKGDSRDNRPSSLRAESTDSDLSLHKYKVKSKEKLLKITLKKQKHRIKTTGSGDNLDELDESRDSPETEYSMQTLRTLKKMRITAYKPSSRTHGKKQMTQKISEDEEKPKAKQPSRKDGKEKSYTEYVDKYKHQQTEGFDVIKQEPSDVGGSEKEQSTFEEKSQHFKMEPEVRGDRKKGDKWDDVHESKTYSKIEDENASDRKTESTRDTGKSKEDTYKLSKEERGTKQEEIHKRTSNETIATASVIKGDTSYVDIKHKPKTHKDSKETIATTHPQGPLSPSGPNTESPYVTYPPTSGSSGAHTGYETQSYDPNVSYVPMPYIDPTYPETSPSSGYTGPQYPIQPADPNAVYSPSPRIDPIYPAVSNGQGRGSTSNGGYDQLKKKKNGSGSQQKNAETSQHTEHKPYADKGPTKSSTSSAPGYMPLPQKKSTPPTSPHIGEQFPSTSKVSTSPRYKNEILPPSGSKIQQGSEHASQLKHSSEMPDGSSYIPMKKRDSLNEQGPAVLPPQSSTRRIHSPRASQDMYIPLPQKSVPKQGSQLIQHGSHDSTAQKDIFKKDTSQGGVTQQSPQTEGSSRPQNTHAGDSSRPTQSTSADNQPESSRQDHYTPLPQNPMQMHSPQISQHGGHSYGQATNKDNRETSSSYENNRIGIVPQEQNIHPSYTPSADQNNREHTRTDKDNRLVTEAQQQKDNVNYGPSLDQDSRGSQRADIDNRFETDNRESQRTDADNRIAAVPQQQTIHPSYRPSRDKTSHGFSGPHGVNLYGDGSMYIPLPRPSNTMQRPFGVMQRCNHDKATTSGVSERYRILCNEYQQPTPSYRPTQQLQQQPTQQMQQQQQYMAQPRPQYVQDICEETSYYGEIVYDVRPRQEPSCLDDHGRNVRQQKKVHGLCEAEEQYLSTNSASDYGSCHEDDYPYEACTTQESPILPRRTIPEFTGCPCMIDIYLNLFALYCGESEKRNMR